MDTACHLCPRNCGVDRTRTQGFCGAPHAVWLARAALHAWEEPPISGTRGSGAVFFCGCNLRCVYCQNGEISRPQSGSVGRLLSDDEFLSVLLHLADSGAHNLNFVTPTHYADALRRVLPAVRKHTDIPFIYNCGGYESVETLRSLEGLIDVYLPDFKYVSPALAEAYSAAPDYADVASAALTEMVRQTGPVVFDENGLIRRGVIVRHLVLPGARADSAAVLARIAACVPPQDIRISLMSQYTPDFAPPACRALRRRITTFEYQSVLQAAETYGFDGYFQERSSADKAFTPDFHEITF